MAEEDRVILRRIPPEEEGSLHKRTIFREHLACRTATSFALQPKPDEDFPSWSYSDITDPRQLIAIEIQKGADMTGWQVVNVSVAQVESLKIHVVPDPTQEDPGHCVIKPGDSGKFGRRVWSKLALMTRIVYTQAGGTE